MSTNELMYFFVLLCLSLIFGNIILNIIEKKTWAKIIFISIIILIIISNVLFLVLLLGEIL